MPDEKDSAVPSRGVSDGPAARDAARSAFEDTTVVGLQVVGGHLGSNERRARLDQVQGRGAPRTFLLASEEIVVGRSREAHVFIEGERISRNHMVVRRSGAGFSFSDLNSSNGVYLNGVKAHSAVLHEGDQLQLGDVVLVYHEGA